MFNKLAASLLLVLSLVIPVGAVELNVRGQVAMGQGGLPGSVDGQIIPDAMGPKWLTEDIVVFPSLSRPVLVTLNLRTGERVDVAPRGTNDLAAGGGVWAAWLAGYGLYTSTGLHLPNAGLIGVGPNGEVAYVPNRQEGLGVNVRERDGSEWRLTDGIVYDLQLFGGGRAIWTANQQVFVRGIPQPQVAPGGVWRPRVVTLEGELWIVYFSGQFGVIAHPFTDASRGYVLAAPGVNAFVHDAVSLNGNTFRFAAASRAGELPEDLMRRDVNVRTEPRTAFGTTPPLPPPVEVCGDKIDNDGDGLIDENPPCPPVTPPPPQDNGTIPCPAWNGIVDGVVTFPEIYILSRVCNKNVRNYATVLRQIENEFYKYGFGLQADSGGTMRGRVYMPTPICPNAAPRNEQERHLGVRQEEVCWDQLGRFVDIVNNDVNGNPVKWVYAGERGPQPYQPVSDPPPPTNEVEQLKKRVAELERDNAELLAASNSLRDDLHTVNEALLTTQSNLETALDNLDAANKEIVFLKAEVERLKKNGCRVIGGPGWVRSLFGIRCEPNE